MGRASGRMVFWRQIVGLDVKSFDHYDSMFITCTIKQSDILPEVDVHLPITTVVALVGQLELEGSSVKDVGLALGHRQDVLWVGFGDHEFGGFGCGRHDASLGEISTDQADLLGEGTVNHPGEKTIQLKTSISRKVSRSSTISMPCG
jgi:hypothetical protein